MLTNTVRCLSRFPYMGLTKNKGKKLLKKLPKKLLLTGTLRMVPINTTLNFFLVGNYMKFKVLCLLALS